MDEEARVVALSRDSRAAWASTQGKLGEHELDAGRVSWRVARRVSWDNLIGFARRITLDAIEKENDMERSK